MAFPKGRGDLCVAVASARPDDLMPLRASLEARGFRLELYRDAWSLLEAARGTAWTLVLLDARSLPLKDTLEQLVERNAFQPVAVLTDQEPEVFHEATEGLGVLAPLPACPSVGDLEPVLASLRAVGGLDPRLEEAQLRLDTQRRKHHPGCVVCWDRHPIGLKVAFRATGEHTVDGLFPCGTSFEGYRGILHGGVASGLMDGAMASCLLAKGVEAYTVDLRVRYRKAVAIGVPVTVRGEWLRNEGPLHLLQASLEQGGLRCATARAKFFEGMPDRPDRPMPGGAGVRHLLNQARRRLA